jgi:hypothetical protein
MPDVAPRRKTFSPISIFSIARRAPAASRTASVAAMISGPMPSPSATVIGTGFPAPPCCSLMDTSEKAGIIPGDLAACRAAGRNQAAGCHRR